MGFFIYFFLSYGFFLLSMTLTFAVTYCALWIITKNDFNVRVEKLDILPISIPYLIWGILIYVTIRGKSLSNIFIEPIILGFGTGLVLLIIKKWNFPFKNLIGFLIIVLWSIVVYFLTPGLSE